MSSCSRQVHAGSASQQGKQVTLFGDIVEKLCCHPAYRLLSLRALPQMPPASLDFTTFTWPAILRRLRQMQITGACLPSSPGHLLFTLSTLDCSSAVGLWLLMCGFLTCSGDVYMSVLCCHVDYAAGRSWSL